MIFNCLRDLNGSGLYWVGYIGFHWGGLGPIKPIGVLPSLCDFVVYVASMFHILFQMVQYISICFMSWF